MSALQVLVQAIPLSNQLLLPVSEPLLLALHLHCKSLAHVLFFFLELRIVQLSWPSLAELSSLHLLRTVSFVMHLFGCVDQIKHVSANKN